jgi:hypothetical protein
MPDGVTHDYWIDLNNNISEIKDHVQNLIEMKGIPFLEQFKSIEKILYYYDKYDEIPFNTKDRSKFSVALIYYGLGDVNKYKEYIKTLILNCSNKRFVEHIKEINNKLE